jgi:hypothetical protein
MTRGGEAPAEAAAEFVEGPDNAATSVGGLRTNDHGLFSESELNH